MALPHEVVKVTLSGTMFSGQEIWSTGFHMGYEDQAAAAITPQGVADVAGAWGTFFSLATSQIHSNYTFSMCKMARIGVDGKTIPDSAEYYSPPTAINGGYSGPAFPPQIALVATLANSLPRGLATKGRMFLPGVTVSPDNTGHIASNVTGNIATNLQAFFNTVFQDADLPGNPVLISTGNALQLRPGAVRNVTQIRVGNVFDTQRRRRNALMEQYTIKPVSVG
jgi:hypothetical protein